MKINKILAAGIAATLAVTSLAAVASAETVSQTFDMAKTIGTETLTYCVAKFTDNTAIQNTITEGQIFAYATAAARANGWVVDGGEVKVTGTRNGATNTVTESYKMAVWDKTIGTAKTKEAVLQFVDGAVNQVGQQNITSFDKITGMEVWVTVKRTIKSEGAKINGYGNWATSDADTMVDLVYGWAEDYGYEVGGGTKPGEGTAPGDGAINDLYWFLGTSIVGTWYNANLETKDLYAFLEKTTDSTTIMRQDVKLLSGTGAWWSDTHKTDEDDYDGNQTFDSNNMGTAPVWFGGLASQVADFFNKQTNGKITFNFTANAGSSSSWKNGGVPSTEVGLKSAVAGTTMGLFINYNQSTGSLQTLGEIDGTSIIFDISTILNDMGGLTKGNISDIYYGMNKGIAYKNDDYKSIHANVWYGSDSDNHAIGYLVESVVLSYEDAADVDAAEEEVVDEPEDIDEPEEEPEDIDEPEEEPEEEPEDEPEEEEFTIEPEEEEEENNGDVDIIEPTNTAKADDDANPGTGVALAVVPAIVAAAAVVVSKKRK